MLQAARFDRGTFDLLALGEDLLSATKIGISGRHVLEALVLAGAVVMGHEGGDLSLQLARQIIVVEQDPVLECLMPALDFALGLRMIGGAANMRHALVSERVGELLADVGSALAPTEGIG